MRRSTQRLTALLASCFVLGAITAATPQDEEASNEPDVVVDTSVMQVGESPSPDAILITPTLVTISEIESTIDLPAAARLKESQEDPKNPKAAFTKDQLAEIFSDTPKFIYFPEGVDPMIIPWVREQIVAEELAAEALVAFNARDFDLAEAKWTEIREKYPNTTQGQEAARQIAGIIEARERAQRPDAPPVTRPEAPVEQAVVELPTWIRQNTNGVLLQESGDNIVVVGNEFLRVGDAVPRYAGVTIKAISASEVTFSFQNKEFVHEVVGTF
jgi:hypothetical protein